MQCRKSQKVTQKVENIFNLLKGDNSKNKYTDEQKQNVI